MQDFDFTQIPKQEYKHCPGCEQQFIAFPNDTHCMECQYYMDHPDRVPKYWTWARSGTKHWTAAATWPDGEPLPQVGDTIRINRKDGSSSDHLVTEVDGVTYDIQDRGTLRCWVK